MIGDSDRRLERLFQLPYLHRALPDLSEADLVGMWSRLHWRQVRPGEMILREEEPATSFYIVTSGEVELAFAGQDGVPARLARIGPGGFFGEVGCLTGRSDGAVRATTTGELIVFERKGFIDLMTHSPVVRRDVEAQMQRLHELKYATRPAPAGAVGQSGGQG